MTKTKHRAWSRVVSLLLVTILMLGSLSMLPSFTAYANTNGGNTSTQGTGIDGAAANGNGSGSNTNIMTTSVDCLAFTFWEKNASDQWELKYGIVQIANPLSGWYCGPAYANGNHFPKTLNDPHNYMNAYLDKICNSSVSRPTVEWKLYGQNYFVYTANSQSYMKEYISTVKCGGGGSPFADKSTGLCGMSDADAYAICQNQLDPPTNPAAAQVVGNLEMTYRTLTGSTAMLANGTLEMGVSEICLSLNNKGVPTSGESTTVMGTFYPEALNSLRCAETVPILFNPGQQACFTYQGGGGVSGAVSTYDVRHNPSYPSHAEDPWQSPQIEPKKGNYLINKIYVDLSGGGASHTYRTQKVCKDIYISDEVGRIDDDWDFQYWTLSTITTTGFSHSNYSGMMNDPIKYTTTGLTDVQNVAASRNNMNLKQVNLLFIKSSNGQPGSTIMTEQTLGIGTTQTFDYVALDGRDEVGYKREAVGNCGYQIYVGTWSDGTYGCTCGQTPHTAACLIGQSTPAYAHYTTCNASQTHLAGRTTTRTVTIGSAFFQTISYGNAVGTTYGASRSGGTYTFTRSTSNVEPYHTNSGSNHNPSASALTVTNNVKIQINGFALYRNTGLGDYIEPAFYNSAFVENFIDESAWGWAPHISRVGSSEFNAQVDSSTYTYGLNTSTTSRKTSGAGWQALPSLDGYGSRGFIVTIPKGASSSLSNSDQNHPSTIHSATFRTSGSDLLNTIQVWSYLAHPNIPAAEFGDKLEYDLSIRPFVIMRLPHAQDGSSPAQWDTAINRDKAAYVMVKGEYDRTLHLKSAYSARAYARDGIAVKPNTLLNDARVGKYFIDTLGWQGASAPYAIPGGSVIYVGQQATAMQKDATGVIGAVDVDITIPWIGYSPMHWQLDDNLADYFDVQADHMQQQYMTQIYMMEGREWVKRYYDEPSMDDAYRLSSAHYSLDDYYSECEEALETVYLALYAYDTVDRDSFQLKDGMLIKERNALTPTGAILSNPGTILLDGASRTVHDDTKYNFGGLSDHIYVRVVRDYYPTTQFSFVGIDTCGGAFTISGPPFSWDVREMSDSVIMTYLSYCTQLYNDLGQPASVGAFKYALKNIDIETNPDAARSMYEFACTWSIAGFSNTAVRARLAEAYALQDRLDTRFNDPIKGQITYTLYLKDGQKSSSAVYNGADPSLVARAEQLANSVEHDVGNDYTWYTDGDWYNEAVLPYYSVYTRQTFSLTFPSESSTIIDPSFMGLSEGKDDMFKADDKAWNGLVVGLAYDNMTQSDFDANMRLELPAWGTANTNVELAPIGVSHPMAISNTSVNDIY